MVGLDFEPTLWLTAKSLLLTYQPYLKIVFQKNTMCKWHVLISDTLIIASLSTTAYFASVKKNACFAGPLH